MQEEVASFLRMQLCRSAETGDMQEAAAQLRRFLELERNAHAASLDLRGADQKIRNMPRLRAVK